MIGWYLDRCLQTATPIAEALKLPLYVEHGIGEWFSPVAPGTGLHPRPGSASSLKKYFPLVDTRWATTWLPSRKGETVAEVHERTASFLQAFFARFDEYESAPSDSPDSDFGRHKNVLLVGHAASVITLTRELAGEKDMPIRVGCCSVTTLVPKTDAKRSGNGVGGGNALVGQWDVTIKAGAEFLKGGVERDWGFEDIEVEEGRVVNDQGVPGTEGEEEGPKDFGLQVALAIDPSATNSRL